MAIDKRVKVTVGARIHPDKKDMLKKYCDDNNIRLQDLIEDFIDETLQIKEEQSEYMKDGRKNRNF